jgi:hypothetical protein
LAHSLTVQSSYAVSRLLHQLLLLLLEGVALLHHLLLLLLLEGVVAIVRLEEQEGLAVGEPVVDVL